MEPTNSPSCQIHHTHNDHWVCSIYYNSRIYLIDSLGNDRDTDRIIPDGLKIQLSNIYGKDLKLITVFVMKQTNNTDCGLFAIAYATSFCLNKKLCHDVIFNSSKLRQHLFNYLSNGYMSDFPKTGKLLGIRSVEAKI